MAIIEAHGISKQLQDSERPPRHIPGARARFLPIAALRNVDGRGLCQLRDPARRDDRRSWAGTGAARARCSRSCQVSISRTTDGSIARAPITPILELGVGWNPELDAIDNICLLGSVMGMSLQEIRAAVDEILAFAELERFANLKLQHYSSGMASRLAYSVAFKAVREVLVLDEIFAVGDAGFKARCEERYRTLSAAGHTVIIVSHDPRIIETFCSRALLLDRGRVVLERHRRRSRQSLSPIVATRRRLAGSLPERMRSSQRTVVSSEESIDCAERRSDLPAARFAKGLRVLMRIGQVPVRRASGAAQRPTRAPEESVPRFSRCST